MVVILRLPHLVLANVGDHDGFAARFFPEIVDDVRGVEMPIVGQALNILNCRVAFEFADVAKPVTAFPVFQAREKLFEHLARIADESSVHFHVLVDLGAVDLDVNLAGFLGVGAQIAGDTVVKAHADGDEQVSFLNGVIDPGLAVHPHHAEVKGIAGWEAADAEQGHSHGQIAGVYELIEDAHCAGHHDPMAGEN